SSWAWSFRQAQCLCLYLLQERNPCKIRIGHHHKSKFPAGNKYERADESVITASMRNYEATVFLFQKPTQADCTAGLAAWSATSIFHFRRRLPHQIIGRTLQDALTVKLAAIQIHHRPSGHVVDAREQSGTRIVWPVVRVSGHCHQWRVALFSRLPLGVSIRD